MVTEKEFLKVLNNKDKGPKPYDTTAEVVRVEDGVAWVHIDGGVEETPAELTINAVKGDRVKVRLVGGQAFLIGNGTAPPTDDRTALEALGTAGVARRTAVSAEKTANVTEQRTRPAITSMTTYFKLSNGTPAQPTEEDHTGWSEEEPLWDPESDEQLYYSVRTRTVQGLINWTYPHVLSSYANIAILQNAILLEVGDGSALAYIDDSDGDHILDNTGDPILADIGSIRDAYSYIRVESDKIRSEVSETYVSKGNSQIESLSSVMEQTAEGLDIYSTVNGSVQATHTHIDGDSFDVVKDGKVIASFGATTTLGNSERTDWPGIYDSFMELTDSYLKIKPRSSYYEPWCTGLTNNSIFGIFKTAEYDPTYSMNDTFAEFEVGEHGLTYGDQSSNTFFKIGIYTYQGEGPSSYEYESCLWLGHTRITASELAALKALIS